MQYPLVRLLERQHALVSTRQLHDAIGEGAARNLLDRKHLVRVRRSVYGPPGVASYWERELMSAVLAAPAAAVASHTAAGRLFEIVGCEAAGVELTIPYATSLVLPNATVHRTISPDRRWRAKNLIPTTSATRTIIDLSAVLTYGRMARALDDALNRQLTSVRRIDAELVSVGSRGRRRTRCLKLLLEERTGTRYELNGPLHQRVVRWLEDAGCDNFHVEHPIRVDGRMRFLDIAWPDHKMAIEVDGFAHHRSRTAFDDDRNRNNGLVLLGWRVLHVTSNTRRSDLLRMITPTIECFS